MKKQNFAKNDGQRDSINPSQEATFSNDKNVKRSNQNNKNKQKKSK